MLDSMRKAAGTWVAKALMFLLVASFAIWGIGDVVRNYGSNTLAEVGGVTITPEQFREEYDRELRLAQRRFGQALTREQAHAIGLDRQVLGRMITEAVLSERARQLGLNVSDETIAKQVMDNPAFRGPSGRFDRNYFNEILRSNGLNERAYIALERQNELRQQLTDALAGGVVAPDPLVEAVHRFRTEKRSIDYVDVTADAVGEIPTPDETTLKAYYDAHKADFRAPEYRSVTLLPLDPAELASKIQVSDADARALYDSQKDRYVEPERRDIRQIVFPSKQEAEAAEQKLKSGESFEQLAEARGLKPADTDLGLKSRAELLDPDVAKAAFALPEGGVSEPVQTRFGWALVKVAEIKPGADKSFEDVKGEIKQEIARERAGKDILDVHDKVEDTLASGATLAETAEKLGLKTRSIEVDRQGRTPSGETVTGLPPELLGQAFQASTGMQNDPIQTDNGRGYLWYEVTKITPARDRSFEEAKDMVAARWRDEQLRDKIKALADQVVEAVKSGKTLDAAAGEHGLTALKSEPFTRSNTPPMLTRPGVQAVFATPDGSVGEAPGTTAPDRVVFRVASDSTPPFDPKSPEAQALRSQIAGGLANDVLSAYVTELQGRMGVSINTRALQAATGEPAS